MGINTRLNNSFNIDSKWRPDFGSQANQLLTETEESALHLLVCSQSGPDVKQIQAYARYLSDLLKAQLTHYCPKDGADHHLKDIIETAACGHDLVILEEPDQTLIRRILQGLPGCKAAERIPTSVLIARNPQMPLKKILFVTRGLRGVDDIAVDWLVRLAWSSQAEVTVLALVPAVSTTYQQAMTYMPHGMADWLTTDTPLGCQLRRIAHHLTEWEINGTLHFRQGSPEQQIQHELAAATYSLIVVADEPDNWWQRRLIGKVVSPLLRWVNQPVLVVKPALEQGS